MDKTVRQKSAARRQAVARQEPATREPPDDCGGDPHAKGTMREPAQIPSGGHGELGDALENLEKEKGDWSKGGG
jgi:hypothetical protein